jgi:hypothetical protein
MRILFLTVLLMASSVVSKAQSTELILMGGSSHFLGDLGGKPTLGTNDFSDLDLNTTRFAVGIGFRLRLAKSFALRADLFYSRVAGDDRNTDNLERRGRNLNFHSHILDAHLLAELYVGSKKRLYFFGGAGIFTFNPKTKYNGETYELQPLGTEGQNFLANKSPYDRNAISFPYGIGYKIPIAGGNGGYLTLEAMFRKTTTDYIDDVSTVFADNAQIAANGGAIAGILADRSISTIPGFSDPGAIRGDPKNNDNFTYFLITYNIPLGRSSGSGFGGSKRSRGKFKFGKNKCYDF